MSIPTTILFIIFGLIWLYIANQLILMIKMNKNEEFKQQYFKKRGYTVPFMIKAAITMLIFVSATMCLLWFS